MRFNKFVKYIIIPLLFFLQTSEKLTENMNKMLNILKQVCTKLL